MPRSCATRQTPCQSRLWDPHPPMGGDDKKLSRRNPCNPLKRLDSKERIQGNPSFSNALLRQDSKPGRDGPGESKRSDSMVLLGARDKRPAMTRCVGNGLARGPQTATATRANISFMEIGNHARLEKRGTAARRGAASREKGLGCPPADLILRPPSPKATGLEGGSPAAQSAPSPFEAPCFARLLRVRARGAWQLRTDRKWRPSH